MSLNIVARARNNYSCATYNIRITMIIIMCILCSVRAAACVGGEATTTGRTIRKEDLCKSGVRLVTNVSYSGFPTGPLFQLFIFLVGSLLRRHSYCCLFTGVEERIYARAAYRTCVCVYHTVTCVLYVCAYVIE